MAGSVQVGKPDRSRRGPKREVLGFSLLELLLVVAIILIVATIAIPSLVRSRQSANESAAVSTLRLFNASQQIYAIATRGPFGTVPELVAVELVDDRFLGPKSGYLFEAVLPGDRLDYMMTATAVTPVAGRYDYYTTPENVIRYTTTAGRAPAGQAGMPVND